MFNLNCLASVHKTKLMVVAQTFYLDKHQNKIQTEIVLHYNFILVKNSKIYRLSQKNVK